ncbi:MAG TPA: alpha/beta hydrolase [Burkholderiales bacterium]|nr:alpha/beta hydrolase [Burkholderiales bacterium]
MAVSRRAILGGAAACALLAAAPALAQQPAPRAKGPRVWLDLDQAELDDAYDQSVYAPNQKQVTGRYVTNSDAVRARLGEPRRFAYGPTPVEGLDVWTTKRPDAPINVFVHGGAWRVGTAAAYAFPAELFVNAGAHFVVLDFASVTDLGGDLSAMADQVRRGIAWVHRNAKTFGGDPDRLYLSGHSSGAHLAGVALATDWKKDFGLPADTVKGGLCCSGMFDMKPVRLSARSRYVKFTDAMEDAISAQRHLDRLNAPVVLAHGTLETPEFQRQSRDFAAAVKAAGKPAQLLVAQGYNHFEILETLASPYGLLGRAVLEQMKLG